MSDYELITFSQADGVARLALNAPPLNVMTIPMMRELGHALDGIGMDDSLKALVIEAAEGSKAFSAGVDVNDHTEDKVEEMIEVFHHIFRVLAKLEIPVVGVVNGAALGGGCELALFCDMIVASERAKFGQPEIQVGVFPPIAAIVLPGLVGPKNAAELLLTGQTFSAEDALRVGLVNRVVPPDQLAGATDDLLQSLTTLSAVVLRMTKRAYRIGLGDDFEQKLAEAERVYLSELMTTRDAQEGLAAFMEKRAPEWTNS